MRDRLGEFSLSLHPEKTRLIEFGRNGQVACERRLWLFRLPRRADKRSGSSGVPASRHHTVAAGAIAP